MNGVISSERIPIKAWLPLEEIEASAMVQLKNCANLRFAYRHIAAMPDVHAGYGATVGSVIAMKGAVVPSAVGVDIGCGMMAMKTEFSADKVIAKLPEIVASIKRSVPTGFNQHSKPSEKGWDGCMNFPPSGAPFLDKAFHQMGTLGGGNHFIEICLDENRAVWIMLHSGSRHVGLKIANHFIERAKALMKKYLINLPDDYLAFLPVGTKDYDEYMVAVEWAQLYASENRDAMMQMIRKDIGFAVDEMSAFTQSVNCHHNYAAWENHFGENVIVVRKGAIRVREGEAGIVPGSMGAKSYIVTGKGCAESFDSCAHGAGRRMSRGAARAAFTVEDLAKQTEGIDCPKDESVIDEAPGAYKDIDAVMAHQADLVTVTATLKQIACLKGSDSGRRRRRK